MELLISLSVCGETVVADEAAAVAGALSFEPWAGINDSVFGFSDVSGVAGFGAGAGTGAGAGAGAGTGAMVATTTGGGAGATGTGAASRRKSAGERQTKGVSSAVRPVFSGTSSGRKVQINKPASTCNSPTPIKAGAKGSSGGRCWTAADMASVFQRRADGDSRVPDGGRTHRVHDFQQTRCRQ